MKELIPDKDVESAVSRGYHVSDGNAYLRRRWEQFCRVTMHPAVTVEIDQEDPQFASVSMDAEKDSGARKLDPKTAERLKSKLEFASGMAFALSSGPTQISTRGVDRVRIQDADTVARDLIEAWSVAEEEEGEGLMLGVNPTNRSFW